MYIFCMSSLGRTNTDRASLREGGSSVILECSLVHFSSRSMSDPTPYGDVTWRVERSEWNAESDDT